VNASRQGEVVAVCTSPEKGMRKQDVGHARLVVASGLAGDAHAGPGDRQVSLLADESVDKMRSLGLDVGPGDFAENLTIRGLDLCALPIGSCLRVGKQARLRITRIGKECHSRCTIYFQAGDCVMPREGVFAEVLEGGEVCNGDPVEIVGEEVADG